MAPMFSFSREPFDAFERAYPFLCARETSSKASKRQLFPSCILPGLLYLGDLTDAAALPRLREQLNIRACVTALAELPPSLKASVAEAKVEHTWCNVRDVEEADIKAHFATAIAKIDAAKQSGRAIFVHCSRGVSRSASLCIAYLMKTEGWSAKRARQVVEERRPIILPNDGFWKCLCEYEKELSGERTGVYAPAPKTKGVDELDFELLRSGRQSRRTAARRCWWRRVGSRSRRCRSASTRCTPLAARSRATFPSSILRPLAITRRWSTTSTEAST